MGALFLSLVCLLKGRRAPLRLALMWLVTGLSLGCTAQLSTLGDGEESSETSSQASNSSQPPSSGADTSRSEVESSTSEAVTVGSSSSQVDAGHVGNPTFDDGQAPQVSLRLLASAPMDGDTGVEVTAGLRLTFDRDIVVGTGELRLLEVDSDVAFEVNVGDAELVEVKGAQATITWHATNRLGFATQYHVQIDAGAFVAADDGAEFSGVDGTSFSFQTEEPEPVTLQATFPDSTGRAGLEPVLTMVFNVDVSTGGAGSVSLFAEGAPEPVAQVLLTDATQVSFNGPQVDVSLGVRLAYATRYYVVLDSGAIRSVDGAVYGGFSDPEVFWFTTADQPVLTLLDTDPVDVGVPRSDVPLTASFAFSFDDVIVAGAGAFKVYEASDDSLVYEVAVSSVNIQGNTLTIGLPGALEGQTQYYATLDAGAVLGVGDGVFAGLLGDDQLVFTTAAASLPDVVLTAVTPIDGATDVSVGTTIELTFDVAVQTGLGSISLHDRDTGETLVDVSVTSPAVSVVGNTVTLTPSQSLPGSTTIEIRVSGGALTGLDGARFAGLTGVEYAFVTESSFGLLQFTPTGNGVASETNLTLTFSEDVAVGAGEISVRVGNKVIEAIDVPDSRVTVAGKTATIDLDNILAGAQTFEVRVDATAFVEAGGDGVMFGVDAGAWTFTTRAIAAPAGVGVGLVLWLDADYSAGIKGGDQVALWADRSGQYHNVVQADSDQQPALAANAMNHRNALSFDGTDDVLRALDLIKTSNLDGFIVWQSSVAPSTTIHSSLLANGANFEVNHGHPLGEDVSNSFAACVGSDCPNSQWYLAQFLPAPRANETYVWNFGYSASETLIFARSNAGAIEEQTGPSAAPVDATVPLSVGGEPINCTEDCYYAGYIAEVLLYSTPLSDVQRLDVTEYLYDKWVAAEGSCGSGERRGPNGKCYYYSTASAAWDNARNACKGRGTGWDLAEVRNELDHRFLTTEVLPAGATAWVGGQDGNPIETWRWLSDSQAFWQGRETGTAAPGAFTVWEAGQPNDTDAVLHCVRYRNTNGTWAWSDGSCTESATYVCQGPAD